MQRKLQITVKIIVEYGAQKVSLPPCDLLYYSSTKTLETYNIEVIKLCVNDFLFLLLITKQFKSHCV